MITVETENSIIIHLPRELSFVMEEEICSEVEQEITINDDCFVGETVADINQFVLSYNTKSKMDKRKISFLLDEEIVESLDETFSELSKVIYEGDAFVHI